MKGMNPIFPIWVIFAAVVSTSCGLLDAEITDMSSRSCVYADEWETVDHHYTDGTSVADWPIRIVASPDGRIFVLGYRLTPGTEYLGTNKASGLLRGSLSGSDGSWSELLTYRYEDKPTFFSGAFILADRYLFVGRMKEADDSWSLGVARLKPDNSMEYVSKFQLASVTSGTATISVFGFLSLEDQTLLMSGQALNASSKWIAFDARSTDLGQTWVEGPEFALKTNMPSFGVNLYKTSDGSIVQDGLGVTDPGNKFSAFLRRSVNQGQSFSPLSEQRYEETKHTYRLGLLETKEGYWHHLVSSWDTSGVKRYIVYRSSDQGSSWSLASDMSLEEFTSGDIDFGNNAGPKADKTGRLWLAVKLTENSEQYVGYYTSSDEGLSWEFHSKYQYDAGETISHSMPLELAPDGSLYDIHTATDGTYVRWITRRLPCK
jgi:hypothetical protein